jgi:hypothetical protein
LATFVNPEGIWVYKYIFTVLRDPSSQQFVVEWLPPAIKSLQGAILFYFPFFTATFILIFTRRRIERTDILIYFIFSIFGLSASRNSIYFLLAIAPIVSRYMPKNQHGEITANVDGRIAPKSERRAGNYGYLNLIIVCAALVGIGIHSPWAKSHVFGKSLLDPNTPVGAMNYIDEHSLKGNIFHPQIYGDYLIWRLWPAQRSFIDGRVHLFGKSFTNFYQRVTHDSNWQEMLKQYDIDYLLLCNERKFFSSDRMIDDARSSDSWTLIYEDDQSIIFVRQQK